MDAVLHTVEQVKAASEKQRLLRRCFVIAGILLLLSAAGVGVWKACFDRVYRHCVAEAGTEVSVADFMKGSYTGTIIADMGTPIDTHVPGTYRVYIQSGHFTYRSELKIVDTVAPVAESVDVVSIPGEVHEAEEFVTEIRDETAVEVRFAATPFFDHVRESEVFVLLTDAGGNVTEVMSHLSVVPVVGEVVAEAGTGLPDAEAFSVAADQEIRYATEEEKEAYIQARGKADAADWVDETGEYTVYLVSYGGVYTSRLIMVDTTPPQVETQELQVFIGDALSAEDFILRVTDASQVTGEFVTAPDTSGEGSFTVEAAYTDAAGNTVQKQLRYTVAADTEAPVITGAKDIRVVLGDSVSYKRGVEVTDNHDAEVELVVDASGVDLETLGNYSVTYSAVDSAGNAASKTVKLTVAMPAEVSQETVDLLADSVLEQILKPDMTDYDKAKAIFNWVHSMGYLDKTNHEDPIQAAYDGLYKRSGDCYTYAITSQILLTHAGIPNILIEKIPTRRLHFWNLIDLGEGWYHFDTCRRSDGSSFFYVDNATLMAYSNAHYKSHNYDPEQYPEIQ